MRYYIITLWFAKALTNMYEYWWQHMTFGSITTVTKAIILSYPNLYI